MSTAQLHSAYAELHETAPVSRVNFHDVDIWLITRQEDVRAAMSDRRFSHDEKHVNPTALASPWLALGASTGMPPFLVRTDPPDHTRLRRLVSKAFTARRIAALEPDIQQITNDLLAAMSHHDQADLVESYASQLPVLVIMKLVGVPEERAADFRRWTGLLVSTDPEDLPAIPAAIGEMLQFLGELAEQKRAAPQDDLLSALVAVVDEGDRLSPMELSVMVFLLVAAGHETTQNLIGTGMLTLMQNPAVLQELQADPSLVDVAVEELLRLQSPFKIPQLRYVTEDLEFGGVTMEAGDIVAVQLGAANVDPQEYPNPTQLDLHREGRGHVAFGVGMHYCLGAPLARMEARIAFRSILSRFSDLQLAATPADLRWRPSLYIHGLESLPVTYKVDAPFG